MLIRRKELERMLTERKWTMKKLSEESGVSYATINNGKRGHTISVEAGEKIAKAMGVKIEDLFDRSESKPHRAESVKTISTVENLIAKWDGIGILRIFIDGELIGEVKLANGEKCESLMSEKVIKREIEAWASIGSASIIEIYLGGD